MPTFIDLSHPLEDGQPNYPGDPELRIEAYGDIQVQGYNLTELRMSSHQGTHLDAPFHFYDDGMTVDQIPLEKLFGPALLVDLAPGAALAEQTSITREMLLSHESLFQPGAKILLRTGWDRKYGTSAFFCDYPSLTIEAARWIAERHIALLGLDTPSLSEDDNETHLVLLKPGTDIVVVESLAYLELLPPQFTLAAFPLKIQGRDGSPVRAVAILDP